MLKWVLVPLAALALAAPARAQSTVDPDHIIALLKDAGFPAEYFNDDASYRQVVSQSGNFKFLVEMYDCEAGKTCNTLEFFSNFPMEQPPTREALDAYAGPREGADISLERGGLPRLVLPVELPDEGLTDAQFLDQLKTWETMMTAFVDFLSGKAPPAAATTSTPATPAAS